MDKVLQKVEVFCALMDLTKLKDGLKCVMELSTLCNKFMTDNEPWNSANTVERRRVIIVVLLSAIRVLACLYV